MVDFGPMRRLTAPAEVPPELFVGLPRDFYTNPRNYYLNPQFHAVSSIFIIIKFRLYITWIRKSN